MMKLLDNPFAIANEILQIIKDSKEFLFLVSPYTQFERNESTELKLIKDAIINSLKREVEVNFITRDPDDNKTNVEKRLKFLHDEGCKIYLIPKLHSKIYCNESKALITSMNLILISILNNKEIGLTLNKDLEPNEFSKIISYVKEFTEDSIRKKSVEISPRKEIVYVLKLENNKWYVGKTKDLTKRLQDHKSGMRSPWTQMNKIIDVEEIIEDGDLKTITLDYMKRYGWQNVRGYAWSQWNMKYPPKELRNSNRRESKTFIQGHCVKINKQGFEGEIGKIVGYDGFMYYEIELLKIKKTIKCLENEIERASQNNIKKHEIDLQINHNKSLKLKDQNLKPLIECLDRNPNFKGLYSLGKYYSLHNYPDIHKSDFLSQKIIQLKSLNEEAAKEITEIFLKFINSSSVLNSIINEIDYGIMMPTTKNVNHVSLWGKNIFNKLDIKDITESVYIKPEKAKYFRNYAYKNPHDRELTAKGAFMFNKLSPNFPELNNKKGLILDDVCTTGNQINGLTSLLVSEGVKEVYAFIIGRTKY